MARPLRELSDDEIALVHAYGHQVAVLLGGDHFAGQSTSLVAMGVLLMGARMLELGTPEATRETFKQLSGVLWDYAQKLNEKVDRASFCGPDPEEQLH